MRVSVTDIDQWQWWMSQGLPVEVLRERLQRKGQGSEPARVGTALHRVLELARDGARLDTVRSQGYVFTFLLDAELSLPSVRESRAQWRIDADGIDVELRGRLDGIDASEEATDHKSGARFDPGRLLDKWQWRIYLCMTGRPVFRWNHFTVRRRYASLPHYDVIELNQLQAWRQSHTERRVRETVAEFAHFAVRHALYTGPTRPESEPQEEPIAWEAMV
jgi:hypothetical protein